MAGDWIKMRIDLAEDPAVIGMAESLGMDEFAVVGRLHVLWGWADSQSRDGHASGVTEKWIDRKVQRDGFAAAMAAAGWLLLGDGGIEFPNFDRHNGETAKQRGLATNRKKKSREKVTQDVTDMSRTERDETATREEKRREENIKAPVVPTGDEAAILSAYHSILPRCKGVEVLNPKRKKRIAAAVKLAKQTCATQGWPYDPDGFWQAYFGECAKDPWMRGDVPYKDNPNWKQGLETLIAEDRFAGVMDSAIASMRSRT